MTISTISPVFQFHSHNIRTTLIDNQPWFVAKDVATALGIKWTGHSLGKIPDSWQGVAKLTTHSKGTRGGGIQTLCIISEPAVYKLAFRSNKIEADAFTNWVASEVLPSLRKTGEYKVKQNIIPKKKASVKTKQLALPYKSYEEKCREAVAELVSLRGEIFTVTSKISDVLRAPFWRDTTCTDFKENMNKAIGAFFLSINTNVETMEFLFKAYVEAEKLIRK